MKKGNKKGFTLVELVVVIAIIGVLSAILIPTMMGFVRNAQITSANKAANEMSEAVSQTLTKFDADGYGMKQTATATTIIRVEIVSEGSIIKWTTSVSEPDSFLSNDTADWTVEGTPMTSSDNIVNNSGIPQNLISLELIKYFPDMKQGYGWFAVSGGYVKAAYFNDQGSAVASMEADFDEEGKLVATETVDWERKRCVWDGSNNGVTADGLIIGTSPAIFISRFAEETE